MTDELKIGLAFEVILLLTVLAATGNVTANNVIAEQGASNFNESYTYTFIKDISYDKDVEVIKVQFKNAFRGADSNLVTIDRVWQVSDTNSSQVIINDSHEMMATSGVPLKLREGYELAIKYIDIDGESVHLELSKNGKVVDSTVIIPPNAVEDTYTYTKDLDHSGSVGVIKVHFKNAFRGADSNLASIDRILQVSDTNSSQVIINDSHERTITSGTPLKLVEGYELAIRSIDINGNKVYVELSKSGEVVDAAVIIPLNAVDDTYTYTRDLDNSKAVEIIKVHFKNAFRGTDSNLATVDQVWQASDKNHSKVINNDSDALTLTSGTPLTLSEGYKLALKAIDIDGNKVYVELSKNGEVVDSAIIIQHAAIYYEGLALYGQGKYVEAISAFDKAIEIDPQYAAAWCYKGFALDELGKHDEATKSYDKAIKIDSQYVAAAWNDMGNSHYNAGEYVAAIRYYDEAIKQDSRDKYAWYNKANALRMLHRNSEAEAAYAKARELGYSGTMTLMEMTAK